jgi:LuxR family maltose regulon positive regulatory protein
MLTASIDSLADHREDAYRGASRWLKSAGVGLDDPFNVAAAHCIQSSYFSNAHRFVEARLAIRGAREAAFQTDSIHVDGWVSAYAAMIALHEGGYAAAYPELVDALTRARRALGDDAGICGTMAMVAACCAVQMGLQEESWQLFSAGVRTARTHGFLEATAFGLEAAILLWQGGADDRIAISTLRDIANAYPARLSTMLSCYLIQRLANLGRLDEAQGEADRIGLSPASAPAQHQPAPGGFARLDALLAFTRITLLVGSGQYKAAEVLLAGSTRDPKLQHCASWQVAFALSSAEIAVRTSRQTVAVRLIARAVSLAASRNIVRPFQDKASILAAAIADTKANAWGFANGDERRFFVERCRGLDFEDDSLSERIALIQDDQSALASPLTKRELELLQYVDAGLSNQQIADRGGVTLTTVKWHFQNVFAKLDVTNRSAALSRARALRLLPR